MELVPGDLGNIDSWQRATMGDTAGFWTGHPLVLAEADGTQLLLQEEREETQRDPERAWCVPREALGAAVAGAREDPSALAARLVPILRERGLETALASALASRLAGL